MVADRTSNEKIVKTDLIGLDCLANTLEGMSEVIAKTTIAEAR